MMDLDLATGLPICSWRGASSCARILVHPTWKTKLRKFSARLALILMFFILANPMAHAGDVFCIAVDNKCDQGDGTDSAMSSVGGGESLTGFTLNPASVPVKDAQGLAAIYYKIRPQFLFVKGTGRIGAAVSPSNGDDTFFGNPSFETNTDYLYRRQNKFPFQQTKVALGLAASVFDNEGSMWTRIQLSIGVLGRYIQASNNITPGLGVTFLAGPLQLSAAISKDETGISAEGSVPASIQKDQTTSISATLPLGNVVLDYTKLALTPETGNPVNVDLANITVLLERFIFSAAYRIEKSDRPGFDEGTQSLITKNAKEDIFGSIQYSVFSFAQVGVFYNYFLLSEVSGGLTVFF